MTEKFVCFEIFTHNGKINGEAVSIADTHEKATDLICDHITKMFGVNGHTLEVARRELLSNNRIWRLNDTYAFKISRTHIV